MDQRRQRPSRAFNAQDRHGWVIRSPRVHPQGDGVIRADLPPVDTDVTGRCANADPCRLQVVHGLYNGFANPGQHGIDIRPIFLPPTPGGKGARRRMGLNRRHCHIGRGNPGLLMHQMPNGGHLLGFN